jgi:hypothetical protein
MTSRTDLLAAARASALFTSALPADRQATVTEVSNAIRRAVRTHGGVRGCVSEVATEYGDHPETAVPLMRWARDRSAAGRHRPQESVVDALYPPRRTNCRTYFRCGGGR